MSNRVNIECFFVANQVTRYSFFFHVLIWETWADVTGCGLRSREGKVAHGLLASASRVWDTHVRCGYRIQRSVAHCYWHMQHTCERTRTHVSIGFLHSLRAFLNRRNLAVCGLCESTRSRKPSCKKEPTGKWTGKFYKRLARNSDREKETRKEMSYQSPCLPVLWHTCKFMTLMFAEVCSEVLPWKIIYCLRWQIIRS